jgi:hypothetical protein
MYHQESKSPKSFPHGSMTDMLLTHYNANCNASRRRIKFHSPSPTQSNPNRPIKDGRVSSLIVSTPNPNQISDPIHSYSLYSDSITNQRWHPARTHPLYHSRQACLGLVDSRGPQSQRTPDHHHCSGSLH